MLKNKLSFLGMASAILGLTADLFGKKERINIHSNFTKGLKSRKWHDPARVKAAAARRVLREQRNLRNAERGAFGPDWQAR